MNRRFAAGAMLILPAIILALGNPAHGALTKTRDLSNNYVSGYYPVGQLVNKSGTFWGVTRHGANGHGSIFKMTPAGAISLVEEFAGGGSPANPNAGLVYHAASNAFYGTSESGGSSNFGTVFKVTTGGAVSIIHDFTGGADDGKFPKAGLLVGSDNNLYGTTLNGGDDDSGTVFCINTTGSTFTLIKEFDNSVDAHNPYMGLAEGPDGMLYGSSWYSVGNAGCIYRLNKDGSSYSVVTTFSGADPRGQFPFSDIVRANNNKLYGTCHSGGAHGLGTVFVIDTAGAGTVTLVHAFAGLEGAQPTTGSISPYPQTRLTPGPAGALSGFVYGVTMAGGSFGFGTVFRIDTSTNAVTVVTNFTETAGHGAPNPLAFNSTTMYATSLYGGLTALSGDLGAPFGYGGFMSITTTGTLKLLHSFYQQDVYSPQDGPTAQISSYVFGTAYAGGLFAAGGIYKIHGTTNAYTILYSFNPNQANGHLPLGGLFKAADGAMYGCTTSGGRYGGGTAFKITTSGAYTVIHHFRAGEGTAAFRKITQGTGTDKNLYGTCSSGGAAGYGSVWTMATTGANFKVIHHFTLVGGYYPHSSLVAENDTSTGKTKYLYGVTYVGGAAGTGTLFRVLPGGGGYTVLHDFGGSGYGAYYGGPMVLLGGIIYGVTYNGGTFGHGSIWAYNIAGSSFATIKSLDNASGHGYSSRGGLTTDGTNLYGCCESGGVNSYGTLWKYNPGTGAFTVLYSFAGIAGGNDGNKPIGVSYDSTSGLLYGATEWGGTDDYGTLFKSTLVP